jgi:acyl CoA:acetate/3-ketoacid CoA transferase
MIRLAGKFRVPVTDARLTIDQEGEVRKFTDAVEQIVYLT